jgi:very-short-patch-repair endonuclease
MRHALSDVRIDRFARRQHGAFSRRQAIDSGHTARTISGRLQSSRWLRLDAAVYALASHPFTWHRQAMAATLAFDEALLSGRAAASLHGVEGFPHGALEVAVPPSCKATTRLASKRRTDFVQPTSVDGIPCLTVAFTILSLADRTTPERLDAAVDDVVVRRLVSLEELQDRFATWAPRRRPGVARLRRILDSKGGGDVPPTSELERVLRRFLETEGLPVFQYEHGLPWWPRGQGRVDAYCPDCTLIVEADGRDWHTRERNLVNDRRRDNLATANGHGTLRFTWIDLASYAAENLALLRQTVAARTIL